MEVRGLDGGEEGFEGYADAMVRMGLMEKWDMVYRYRSCHCRCRFSVRRMMGKYSEPTFQGKDVAFSLHTALCRWREMVNQQPQLYTMWR